MCFYCFQFHPCTCVSHITEADSGDTVSMSTTVVRTGLGDVDPIQGESWGVSVHAALLEPTKPGFTGKMKGGGLGI